MRRKKCNQKIELVADDGYDGVTLKCIKPVSDEKMEKKYPHTSHIAEATARSGERVQVLWRDTEERHG